jgi:hypothetical protein
VKGWGGGCVETGSSRKFKREGSTRRGSITFKAAASNNVQCPKFTFFHLEVVSLNQGAVNQISAGSLSQFIWCSF